jgi:hypothetical protein
MHRTKIALRNSKEATLAHRKTQNWHLHAVHRSASMILKQKTFYTARRQHCAIRNKETTLVHRKLRTGINM